MIRYFRINDPYRLVGLLVLMTIVCLPLFIDAPGLTRPELKSILVGEKQNEDFNMYSGVVDNAAPLAAWFHEQVDSVFGRSVLARRITAFILIFLQSAFIGFVFINRKVFNENTYIPSFLFFLLFAFSFDTITLSSELAGLIFLLLALNNLFKELEFRVQRDETIFNLGLFISIATLFSFAYWIFLICMLLALTFFTRLSLQKFLLLIFGFVLPHLLAITIAYVSNSLPKLWDYYYLSNLSFERMRHVTSGTLLMLGAIPAFYFLVSVVMLNREARFSKYQSQLLQIMFLWIAFSFPYLLLCKDLRPQNLIVFIPALSFIFTHFFLFIRRRKFIELNTWVIFLGILTISYLARYNKISSIRYDGLFVTAPNDKIKNRRLLVLGDDQSRLIDNKLATPYLNWSLAAEVFQNPDYYENITEIYHHLTLDPPDVILDKNDLMKGVLFRIPELNKKYEKQGDLYLRKVNR